MANFTKKDLNDMVREHLNWTERNGGCFESGEEKTVGDCLSGLVETACVAHSRRFEGLSQQEAYDHWKAVENELDCDSIDARAVSFLCTSFIAAKLCKQHIIIDSKINQTPYMCDHKDCPVHQAETALSNALD